MILFSVWFHKFQYSVGMELPRPRYMIDRPAYTLADFNREFDRKSRQFPVGEKVKKLFRYDITTSPQSRHPRPPITGALRLTSSVRPAQMTRDSSNRFVSFVSVRCSVSRLKGFLFRHVPVLRWLPKYRVRENLLCDVISGVSAGTIQVPQGGSVLSPLCAHLMLSAAALDPQHNIVLLSSMLL